MSFKEWHLSLVNNYDANSDNWQLVARFFRSWRWRKSLNLHLLVSWIVSKHKIMQAWVILTFRVLVYEWFVGGINLWMDIHLRKTLSADAALCCILLSRVCFFAQHQRILIFNSFISSSESSFLTTNVDFVSKIDNFPTTLNRQFFLFSFSALDTDVIDFSFLPVWFLLALNYLITIAESQQKLSSNYIFSSLYLCITWLKSLLLI